MIEYDTNYCLICNTHVNSLTQHVYFKHNLEIDQYVIEYIYNGIRPKCTHIECDNTTNFDRHLRNFRVYCSKSCGLYSNWAKEEYITKQTESRLKSWDSEDRRREMSIRSLKMWKDPILGPILHEHAKSLGNKGWKSSTKGVHYSNKAGQITYRSTWELEAYQYLDHCNDVGYYETEILKIPYNFDGKSKIYYPDLLIYYIDDTFEVVEIKPSQFVDDDQNVCKFEAAELYCNSKDLKWSIWTELNWPNSSNTYHKYDPKLSESEIRLLNSDPESFSNIYGYL